MSSDVPDFVLQVLRSAIAPTQEQARRLERVRHCDQLFGSSGRYEWEFWCSYKGSLKPDEPATVQKFRALAVTRGVDADAVLKSLGWPVEVPSEQAVEYGRLPCLDRAAAQVNDFTGER